MDDNSLNDLAWHLVKLRKEKRVLEGEIEQVAHDLAEALGQGTKRELGGVHVRVSFAKPGLRIVRSADVPTAFRSMQPDRRLLLQHLATTGQVPAGVELTDGKPIVYATTPGELPNGPPEGAGDEDD